MKLLDEIKDIKSETKDLRSFGLTLGIFLILFAGLLWWRGKGLHFWMIGLGGTLALLGLLLPNLLKPVQKGWMTLAVLIGWVMNRVILSLLFFIAVTPIGLIARLTGKQFLDTAWKDGKDSYWLPHTDKSADKASYENQF